MTSIRLDFRSDLHLAEFEMLHDDEVIPKYAADIVIGRVKGQKVRLEY